MKRSKLRWSIRITAIVVLALLAAPAWIWSTGNQATIEAGKFFRSAQLSPKQLAQTVREHHVKTVLNLRGANPDQSWYRDELAATTSLGITQIDIPLASDQWLSRGQARTLVEVLENADPPILIHCEWGAERTGLVSAIAVLLKEGSTLEQAFDQFSLSHMFVPTRDGLVMRGHLTAYAKWLESARLTHEPATFRRWLLQEYVPGSPSREHWPCDPYPWKVVTTPNRARQVTWARNACPNKTETR